MSRSGPIASRGRCRQHNRRSQSCDRHAALASGHSVVTHREEDCMDQRIIDLYDDFTHRHLDRRLFLEQVTKLVGSSALALTMMAALRSDYARAATIPID